MQRDMELIREILLAIRARNDLRPRHLKLEGRDALQVMRHVEMLYSAGFLEGTEHANANSGGRVSDVFITDLSWAGHDFISALENDAVWSKIKASFSEAELLGMPLSVVKELGVEALKAWAREKLGIGG